MLLILIPEARPEVGERNISRATGVRRQEVGRLPDSAAGTGHIDRVARRVRGIHRNRTHLARGTGDCCRANRRPLLTRQSIGLAEREDAETIAGVVATLLAQARGWQRLLEAQRPAVESYPHCHCPKSNC